MSPQHWTLFHDYDADEDLYAAVTIGPHNPEKDADVAKIADELCKIPGFSESTSVAEVFDHEPTEADKDRHAPEGHRSTDAEESR